MNGILHKELDVIRSTASTQDPEAAGRNMFQFSALAAFVCSYMLTVAILALFGYDWLYVPYDSLAHYS